MVGLFSTYADGTYTDAVISVACKMDVHFTVVYARSSSWFVKYIGAQCNVYGRQANSELFQAWLIGESMFTGQDKMLSEGEKF